MTYATTDLVTVLEDEIQVGESLLHNLGAQRQAILAWDSFALLARLAEKEILLGSLSDLETRQQELFAHLPCALNEEQRALPTVLAQLSAGPEQVALSQLQPRVVEIYQRLRTEEKHLAGLLNNLLDHMRGMLTSLAQSPVHLYSKSGTASSPRLESSLIQGKA